MPSIVALGKPAPEIAYEKVAAIAPRRPPRFEPVVIRGGIVGNAFVPASADTSAATGTSAVADSERDVPSHAAASDRRSPSAPPAPEPVAPQPALAPKGAPR